MAAMYSPRTFSGYGSWRVASLALLVASVSGCLAAPLSTPITYTPASNVAPVAGASSVHVFVVGQDERADKTSVGQYGQQDIATTGDVGDTARNAVRTELQARGFAISNASAPGDVQVRVQLLRFTGSFFSSLLFATYTGEMTMHVEVERPGKGVVYSQNFEATHTYRPSDFGSASDHFGIALSGALQDGIAKLFADPAFSAALLGNSARPKS
jgi:uncharacterized lipoprotein YajG